MPDHNAQFPFEEIRRPNGDYFSSWQDAKNHGFDDDQIWSVTVAEDTWTYGPPHHFVNHVGHIATLERHDGDTYYHEEEMDGDDNLPDE